VSPLPAPRRRQIQAVPHTNHPSGQLFWQIPTKGSAWAGHHSSVLATDSSRPQHTQAVGEESSLTCSPAEPPWLSDAIYPADICLPSSAGVLSPCTGLPEGSTLLSAGVISPLGPVLLPRGACKVSPCLVLRVRYLCEISLRSCRQGCQHWTVALEPRRWNKCFLQVMLWRRHYCVWCLSNYDLRYQLKVVLLALKAS